MLTYHQSGCIATRGPNFWRLSQPVNSTRTCMKWSECWVFQIMVGKLQLQLFFSQQNLVNMTKKKKKCRFEQKVGGLLLTSWNLNETLGYVAPRNLTDRQTDIHPYIHIRSNTLLVQSDIRQWISYIYEECTCKNLVCLLNMCHRLYAISNNPPSIYCKNIIFVIIVCNWFIWSRMPCVHMETTWTKHS